MFRFINVFIVVGFLLFTIPICSGQDQSPSSDVFRDRVLPVLQQYCADCHAPGEMEHIDFLTTETQAHAAKMKLVYAKVAQQMENGQMPPRNCDQPSDAERRLAVNWIKETLFDEKEREQYFAEQVSDYVVDIYEDKRGHLWFGTMHKGAVRFDGTSLRYFTTSNGLPSNAVTSFAEDGSGNMWIGTQEGICKYDGRRITKFGKTENLPDRGGNVYADKQGNIWANMYFGIYRFDGNSFSEFKLPVLMESLPTYASIAGRAALELEDSQGNLWFSTNGAGVFKFDGTSFTHLTKQDGLTTNYVTNILEDNQGRLWFSCLQQHQPKMTGDGGLCRFDGTRFQQFPKIRGLSKNDIYTIFKDGAGNIWIGATGKGVYRYDGKEFTLFGKTDRMDLTWSLGLQAAWEDRQGTLWLGFSGGLFRFAEDRIVNVSKLDLLAGTLPSSFKKSTIRELSARLNDFYVSPEIAKETTKHLNSQLNTGQFDSESTLESFAEALTETVRSISHDKHLLIRRSPPVQAQKNSIERILDQHRQRLQRDSNSDAGFKEAKRLEGNVGYVDIREFSQLPVGRAYADSFMQLLSTSDAIIIDLRQNGGGYPEMVQYLCSYFFDEKVHLNSLYWRQGARTQEFWTLDKVAGQKLADVPLFVLISDRTFSGAEEFSYNMQTQKRATIVGQTSRGGANPGRIMRLNDVLEAIIPVGKAVNPITKTNWEGVGVVPDVKTSPEETLSTAHGLAAVAGRKYRSRVLQNRAALSTELIDSLKSFDDSTEDDSLYLSLRECEQAGLLDQRMINGIGYEYLINFRKPRIAEAIFKVNSRLFPEDANVFDSYAEALSANGKLNEAAKNYMKAIEIAKTVDGADLQLFEENLKKLKARMAKETGSANWLDDMAIPSEPKLLEKQRANQNYDSGRAFLQRNPDRISEFVRRIFQDKRGHLWFGTNGDGVVRHDGNTLEYFSINEGFGGLAVRGIVEDKLGNVWFGTERGLTKYDGKSFSNFNESDGLVSNDVWSIAVDRHGVIWIGTLQGVSRYNGNAFSSFAIPDAEPDPTRGVTSAKIIHSIMEDSKGRMWFGTNGGAYIYDGKSLSNISEKNGLCSNAVNSILEDNNGDIWFATHHNGVCRWDGKSFTHVSAKDGVHGTEAWSLFKDNAGNIWFPTEQYGLYRYDGKSFSNFHTQQGLASHAIQCAFEDKAGRLWAGGWLGLFRLDGNSFRSVPKNGPWQ